MPNYFALFYISLTITSFLVTEVYFWRKPAPSVKPRQIEEHFDMQLYSCLKPQVKPMNEHRHDHEASAAQQSLCDDVEGTYFFVFK